MNLSDVFYKSELSLLFNIFMLSPFYFQCLCIYITAADTRNILNTQQRYLKTSFHLYFVACFTFFMLSAD